MLENFGNFLDFTKNIGTYLVIPLNTSIVTAMPLWGLLAASGAMH